MPAHKEYCYASVTGHFTRISPQGLMSSNMSAQAGLKQSCVTGTYCARPTAVSRLPAQITRLTHTDVALAYTTSNVAAGGVVSLAKAERSCRQQHPQIHTNIVVVLIGLNNTGVKLQLSRTCRPARHRRH